jgi:hypothetical protein
MRKELHQLVDQLSEDDLAHWLVALRNAAEAPSQDVQAWWEKVRRIEAEVWPLLPEGLSVVEMIDDVRNERLDDLLSSR